MSDRPCLSDPPAELAIHHEPREPEEDPTLGIEVGAPAGGEPPHRLVTLGDSLTQGFMSSAIFRTDLSWPAMVARELGIGAAFRIPGYEPPNGPGGLPLDLERLARAFELRFGSRLDWYEVVRAALWLRSYMDAIEDHWERGPGSLPPASGPPPFHNMAVYGWDLLDTALLDADRVRSRLARRPPKDDPLAQSVEGDNDRAALVVLERARAASGAARTVLEAAAALGGDAPEGGGPGIETLVVMLGSNNALGAVAQLRVCWTSDDYLDIPEEERLDAKGPFTVWRPSHFQDEWRRLVGDIRKVAARHVIVCTVPAVTIAPIARGVGGKVRLDSRYFPYYTRPWISDADFDPDRDPHITAEQARAVDSAIDAYNAAIVESVRQARADGLDWYLFDLAAGLDRLASRRYIETPAAQPPWWRPYELPPELAALRPPFDSRFFRSGPGGRTEGGLFSLDGVHPTTSGYGLVAQEVIRVMELAGIEFRRPDGTPRPSPVQVDFRQVLAADSLLSRPPAAVSPTLATLGWLDEMLDWAGRVLP